MRNTMATSDPRVTNRELEHYAISKNIAEQGIVLLENDGTLPFDCSVRRIALFGNGARLTIKGGTGSGDVNTRSYSTVEQGLKNAGCVIVSDGWLDEYSDYIAEARSVYDKGIMEASKTSPFAGLIAMMSNPFCPPEFRSLTKAELADYKADAAIYVLARNSGEGADRKLAKGDYLLSEHEISDIKLLSQQYNRFVLLLNVGGIIDITPVKDSPNAIVLMGQGGAGCGEAVASILFGKVTPSGKLTATWAKNYRDYPFGNEYASVSDEQYDAHYKEGVFVGYRWFDTFGICPQYEFGFGRSYATFNICADSAQLVKQMVLLEITVTNTDLKYPGREVVQVYAMPPVDSVDKPAQALVAFGKTRELAPSESQTLRLSASLRSLASYNERRAAWVIDPGDYLLVCGNSSRSTEPVAVISIPTEIVTEQCKNLMRADVDMRLTSTQAIRRETFNDLPCLTVDVNSVDKITHEYCISTVASEKANATFTDVLEGKVTSRELADTLTAGELAALCVGAARVNLADVTLVGSYSKQLPGAAGETTAELASIGVPSVAMADGPAGVRINPIIHEKDGAYINDPHEDPIFKYILSEEQMAVDLSGTTTKYQYCTALPVATTLSQTWDMAEIERAGCLIGLELEALDIPLWLAPGMNIQRNPLCGRNFEYFSEDPLLSGLCASAMTRGVQSITGRGTTIKHFAANSQETNRNFNNSHVSERALREIYLKGFEICVKEAHPFAVMTALNLINGVHAAADHELLTDLLRCEWAFDGVVMTDWGTTGIPGEVKGQKYDCTYAVDCIKAGNDLIMPGSQRDFDYIRKAIESGELSIESARRCAANVLALCERISKQEV